MPSDLVLKAMNTIHHAVLTLSGGRLGWRLGRMPVLELTTTGRRSGLARTVLLTAPLQEGTALIVVASRGGDDKHPGWLLNLKHDPNVEVALEGQPTRPMVARVATEEERAVLWPRIVAGHRNYGDYQSRTRRVIPLVFLQPTD